MKAILLAAGLALAASPAIAASEITVVDIGAVFNQSLALPAEDTPGSGIGFEQYFEFTLPVKEIVTLSVSDSAFNAALRITGGVLGLNHFTSSAPVSPFQPLGALIDSSPITNVLGGQEATVEPNILDAGSYFAEVSGTSGSSPIHVAIDGTVTALSTPEPSTWAMLLIGAVAMAWGSLTRKRVRELA